MTISYRVVVKGQPVLRTIDEISAVQRAAEHVVKGERTEILTFCDGRLTGTRKVRADKSTFCSANYALRAAMFGGRA